MEWITPILAFIGLVLLLVGFTKNNRWLLLSAGLVLFVAGSTPSFLRGLEDGHRAAAPGQEAPPQ